MGRFDPHHGLSHGSEGTESTSEGPTCSGTPTGSGIAASAQYLSQGGRVHASEDAAQVSDAAQERR